MDVTLVTWTASSAAIGSLVTGYTLAKIQHRRSIKDAGIAEVAAQMRLARFEAVRKLNGEARGLSHCLSHLAGNSSSFNFPYRGGRDSFYAEKARELATSMREFARSDVYILGEPYVAAVHEATDIANLIVDLHVYGAEPSLIRKAREITDKWRERTFVGHDPGLGHLGVNQSFERALYEVFTLAALPDLPSARTRHSARTAWTPRRNRSTGRSQSLESAEDAQGPGNSQQDLSQEDAQGPGNSQQDLPLLLEAKMRSPER